MAEIGYSTIFSLSDCDGQSSTRKVYLHDYQNVREAREGLSQYFSFYNTERFDSSLGNQTHKETYVKRRTAF